MGNGKREKTSLKVKGPSDEEKWVRDAQLSSRFVLHSMHKTLRYCFSPALLAAGGTHTQIVVG